MTRKAALELYAGIGVVLLSVIGYFVIIPLGIVVLDGVDIKALSPDFWPLIVVILLGISGLAVFIQGMAGTGMIPGKKGLDSGSTLTCEMEEGSQDLPLARAAARVGTFLAVLFLIYILIPVIGMVAATMPALLFLTWFSGERRWKIMIPLALALPLILYFFFVYIANVPIPNGIFESMGPS